jgi:hypothetical protein
LPLRLQSLTSFVGAWNQTPMENQWMPLHHGIYGNVLLENSRLSHPPCMYLTRRAGVQQTFALPYTWFGKSKL